MTTLRFDNIDNATQPTPFIAEAVFAVEAVKVNQIREKQQKAKQMLDRLFPLENGSHQSVSSYVIDYHHVLAFFKDGTHSGLKYPKQFAAFTGLRDAPASILLRDDTGSHAEIIFGCQKGTGCVELVTIDDILLETRTTFGTNDGSGASNSTLRHWISLVKGDTCGQSITCSEDREYTAKNGDDYLLKYCFEMR